MKSTLFCLPALIGSNAAGAQSMSRKLPWILLLVCLNFAGLAQNSVKIKWQKTLGGSLTDYAKGVISARNGDLVVFGQTESTDGDVTNPKGQGDVFVSRVSKDGVKKLFETYGEPDSLYPGISYYVIDGYEAANQDIIVLASRNTMLTSEFTLLKFDSAGVFQWKKQLPTIDNYSNAVIEGLSDGGHIVVLSHTDSSYTQQDITLFKLDSAGNQVWTKSFNGSGRENCLDVIATRDFGFAMVGYTYSYDGDFVGNHGSPTQPSGDAFIAKFDSSGNLQWTKCYGGTNHEDFFSIVQDPFDNFYLAGSAYSTDGDLLNVGSTGIWIVKTDNAGTIQWKKTFGGSASQQGYDVSFMSDGSIGVCGWTTSSDGDFSSNVYKHEIWVARLDGTNGKMLMQTFLGNGAVSTAFYVTESVDKDLVLVATASSNVYVDHPLGDYDAWIVKLGEFNTIKGLVFADLNSNSIRDAGESEFANTRINIVRTAPNDTVRIATNDGTFLYNVDTGNFVTSVILDNPYYVGSPASRTSSFNTYFNIDSISFAVQPVPGKQDLKIDLIPLGPARPGFDVQYKIFYKNIGTTVIHNPAVYFVKNAKLTVVSTIPTYTSITVDTVAWNYTVLNPQDTGSIVLNLKVVTPPAANNGDTLSSYAVINPVAGDLTPSDDTSRLKQIVVGSFDPNDKTEANAGVITPAQVLGGEYLNYLIRFQNTGTDTAFNVIVRDTLDAKLDWSSFQMIASSHPYQLTINDNDKLTWEHPGIKLPDSHVNEPLSHGYIAYRIRPKNTVIIGDVIRNTAGIYFDFNLPVATNIQKTTVLQTTALPVRLISFEAMLQSNKKVLVQWKTREEQNVDHYEVLKSADGINFSVHGTISAKSGTANIYSSLDESPIAGITYYRLKSVDSDGKFSYSKIVSVKIDGNALGISIYPNPGNGNFTIKLSGPEQRDVQIKLTDIQGRILWNKNYPTMTANTQIIPINVDGIKKGVYILQVKSGGETITQKLVVQ